MTAAKTLSAARKQPIGNEEPAFALPALRTLSCRKMHRHDGTHGVGTGGGLASQGDKGQKTNDRTSYRSRRGAGSIYFSTALPLHGAVLHVELRCMIVLHGVIPNHVRLHARLFRAAYQIQRILPPGKRWQRRPWQGRAGQGEATEPKRRWVTSCGSHEHIMWVAKEEEG